MSAGQRARDELEDIIGEIKESHKKSNLENIDEAKLYDASPEKKIGWLLKNISSSSTREFSMNFDPVETLFLQKLVSSTTVNKRVVLRMEDYFKGIVFIDYFTSTVLGDEKFTDDLYDIAQKLEHVNPLIDPDMETLVKYSAIYYLSSMGKSMLIKKAGPDNEGARRYARNNYTADNTYFAVRELDSFYDALGSKTYALLQDEQVKSHVKNIRGVNDLKALMFIDCTLQYIDTPKLKDDIWKQLETKDYYAASMKAITNLSREATSRSVDEYLASLQERNTTIPPDRI